MKVYIAGPYTGDELANTCRMMDVFCELIKQGHVPFCPLLSHFADEWSELTYGEKLNYEVWMEYDLSVLRSFGFDCLLLIGESPGSLREKAEAERLGIPVVSSIDELNGIVDKVDDVDFVDGWIL